MHGHCGRVLTGLEVLGCVSGDTLFPRSREREWVGRRVGPEEDGNQKKKKNPGRIKTESMSSSRGRVMSMRTGQ